MSAHNNLSLIGRLTRDVETKFLPNEMCVANFSIAVDGRKKDDPANFIDCAAFGKTAEIIGQYFTKGKAIAISGSLKQDRWEDKATGANRSKISVVVGRFSFLPSNGRDQDNGGEAPQQGVVRKDGRSNYTPPDTPSSSGDDEPPF